MAHGPTTTSWLCRDDFDRERLLDMEHRLKPVRVAAFGALAAALLLSGPWVGWWTLLPLGAAAVAFRLGDQGLDSSPRPEYRLALAWIFAQAMIALSIALTGGPKSQAVAWLAIPVVTLSARFSARGLAAGVALTALLMAGVTLGVDANAVVDHPERLILPVGMLIAIALLSSALMHSDLHHRNEAVIDPLTGMLNRNALADRGRELAQQAVVTGEPIGVVVGDLDRFKSINDQHGHAVGDAVLKDAAYRMRKTLRAFDLVYRLGGEEFLVLLPGASIEGAAEIAERLRAAVSEEPIAGLTITMSLGVSASHGREFDLDAMTAQADVALYEAKRAGRDRVATAGARPVLAAV
jgi:diguanylate cyclase (GGDEF)-like protein